MKETPIIMSTESVRATLEGRKSMTRRVIKGIENVESGASLYLSDGYLSAIHPKNFHGWFYVCDNKGRKIKCPYGKAGDRLWVRETTWKLEQDRSKLIFDADLTNSERADLWDTGCRKHPSLFMPRWASRIMLEITEVRVERLQEITLQDIIAEGTSYFPNHLIAFKELWDSLNAKRGYSWETNPWVWVMSFATGVRLK